MKVLMAALLICMGGSMGFAQSQSQATAAKSDPLSLVETAVNIAANTQQLNFEQYLAIYVGPENWDAAAKDGDLGPFLKLKEKKPSQSAIVFLPRNANTPAPIVCVYFDGDKAFGVTAAKAKDGGNIAASDIADAYKPVTKAMTENKGREFQFVAGEVRTDDDAPLPAYAIKSTAKKAVE